MPVDPTDTASGTDAAFIAESVIEKAAARATAASMKLEGREVPAGHVRSDGVHALLAQRRAASNAVDTKDDVP